MDLTCKHPMIGLPCIDLKTGHLVYRMIKRYASDTAEFLNFPSVQVDGHDFPPVLLRCGQCIACRLNYSREWAVRMCLELKQSSDCWFLTLTYADSELVYSEKLKHVPSLHMDHVSEFVKRLRSYLTDHYGDSEFRFYSAGEYGGQFLRPHYHMIAFNLPVSDLKLYSKTVDGVLFTSDTISRLWSHGHVVLAEVTFSTCAYTSRYTCKKLKTVDSVLTGVEPERSRMSRRPGIGMDYFNLTTYGERIFFAPGRSFTTLGAFDRKLKALDPDRALQISTDKRRIIELLRDVEPVNKPHWDLLADQEYELNRNFKKI